MSEANEQTLKNLPLRYGEDKIGLLARDPQLLYAYWETTKEKLDAFIQEFGLELWEKSIPVLKVTNISDGEIFYVRINDFSDSWYINVSKPNSLYMVELGRKLSDSFFISLVGSNSVSTPSDNISSNTSVCFVNTCNMKHEIQALQKPANTVCYDIPEINWQNVKKFQYIGQSSAQLYGKDFIELLGISSESFLKG